MMPCAPDSKDEKEEAAAKFRESLARAAGKLSSRRREAAGKLRVAVENCLADLAMSGSRFDVRIGWEALVRLYFSFTAS